MSHSLSPSSDMGIVVTGVIQYPCLGPCEKFISNRNEFGAVLIINRISPDQHSGAKLGLSTMDFEPVLNWQDTNLYRLFKQLDNLAQKMAHLFGRGGASASTQATESEPKLCVLHFYGAASENGQSLRKVLALLQDTYLGQLSEAEFVLYDETAGSTSETVLKLGYRPGAETIVWVDFGRGEDDPKFWGKALSSVLNQRPDQQAHVE